LTFHSKYVEDVREQYAEEMSEPKGEYGARDWRKVHKVKLHDL
jgi:hypothetical protein